MEPKIEVSKDGKTMTITVDLDVAGQRSASGKTMVLSSTRGNKAIPAGDEVVYVGLNVYKK